MKTKIAIYLAGRIKKDHEKSDEFFWSEETISQLKMGLNKFDVSFLNPALRTDDLTDQLSVFGRDMLQVFSSDFVFVDARDRRGLGVGAEMMWAKFHKIPVITWAPKNSHYNKELTTILDVVVPNFIHPFVESLSDKIVADLDEGAKWITQTMSDPTYEARGVEFVKGAMQHYKNKQLHLDQPMKELLLANQELSHRIHESTHKGR